MTSPTGVGEVTPVGESISKKHIKDVLSIFFHCFLLMSFEGVKRVSNVYR